MLSLAYKYAKAWKDFDLDFGSGIGAAGSDCGISSKSRSDSKGTQLKCLNWECF